MAKFTHSTTVEGPQQRLRRLAITPTRPRLRIAQLMLNGGGHFSAEQVLRMVNSTNPKISKATVYNTLRLFTQKGLLREVIIDPQRVYYDSRTDTHHHFYDPQSGEITDISSESVEVSGLPSPPPGTEPAEVEIIVRLRPSQT